MSDGNECSVNLHLAAWHAVPGFESKIPGVGLICEDGDWSALLGTYRNSVRKPSLYAGLAYKPLRYINFSAGAFVGFVTGYRSGAIPFGGALVSHDVGAGVALHLQVIPKFRNVNPTTAALSISYRF